MLSMRIDATLTSTSWEWAGDRWRSGSSWISPYDHPALETWSVHDNQRVVFQVRERAPGQLPRSPSSSRAVSARVYNDAVAEASSWQRAHHLIEITPNGTTVSTGALAPAPIYLAAQRGSLHGHWDVARLRDVIAGHHLDTVEIARRLALTGHYSTRTVWQGISLLTERSSVWFHDGELRVRMPDPASHDEPRELAPDAEARVIDGYERLLDAVLADHHYVPERTAIELSGGMDSSNVAMSLATRHGPILASGALIQEGAAGEQQTRRRDAMVRYAGFRDTALRAADYLPMDPQCAPRVRLGPHEEIYIAGHSRLLAKWKADGALWAVAGVGGDEMLSLPPAPHPPLTPADVPSWLAPGVFEALRDQESGIPPAPPISDSTLRALACGAPMYLRAGLWPLYPLADPAMWRFGQWLPFSWRRNKHLARVRLQCLGFDPEVSHPPLRENFHDVLRRSLTRFGPAAIRTMLDTGSPLFDGKFVDADELAAVAVRLERQQLTEQDGMVAHVLRLHHALI
jgi:asparagine synthase (glutamine-hydrolysing)